MLMLYMNSDYDLTEVLVFPLKYSVILDNLKTWNLIKSSIKLKNYFL